MSSRVVTGALVASALGVGVLVGLAAPRGIEDGAASASPAPEVAQSIADLAARDEWVSALADAATAGRLNGMRVVMLVTDGASATTVDEVSTALAGGGATVESIVHLGVEWWDPARSTFRGELADQVSATVTGVEGLGATDVLEHAIVQAIVPGALPQGATDLAAGTDTTGADPNVEGATRQQVLLEVLTRADILSVDHPALDGVDALVIVSGDGPEGAGGAVNAAASVWERYLGSTLVVVAGDPDASDGGVPATAADAISAGEGLPASTRPSVVVIDEQGLAEAQVVMALTEQASGGAGVYGNVGGFDLIAVP